MKGLEQGSSIRFCGLGIVVSRCCKRCAILLVVTEYVFRSYKAFCHQSSMLTIKTTSETRANKCGTDCCVAAKVLEEDVRVCKLFGLQRFHVHRVLSDVMQFMEFLMFRLSLKRRGYWAVGHACLMPQRVGSPRSRYLRRKLQSDCHLL